ncbi:MAG: DUF2089 domain-containing protein [Alphaproteobacteria bacterium]|nr:DUF2089 domain-containing protein [Alphaproteobacteria bacterium]
MHQCANCHKALQVARLRCSACGLVYEGRFHLPRLARLEPAQQALIEQIILAAANLKEVAGHQEISYPTLRKRLDGLIVALRELRQEDETRCQSLLDEVEAGAIKPEEAARLIKELNGGA